MSDADCQMPDVICQRQPLLQYYAPPRKSAKNLDFKRRILGYKRSFDQNTRGDTPSREGGRDYLKIWE